MSSFLQDVRIAVRGYLAKPLFTIVVLSILGLAIGANSAIFSVVNSVLLRPLEYPGASELVSVAERDRTTQRRRSISPPNYFDLKEQARSFAGVAAYWSPSINLSGDGGDPEKALAATCSYDLFSVLGVPPLIGRALTKDDDVPGARQVVVLGHGLWKRRFGGDPNAVGRETKLDGTPTLIVGVMPPAFDFPVAGTELWVPLRLSRTQPPNRAIPPERYRQYRILNVVARLNPDVTVERASLETSAIAARLEADYPEANRRANLAVVPLQDTVVAAARPALLILLAAVACVLLIACANVGSLLLVRAAGRTREVTIRMALGADRGRLVRQMLTESLVLAAAGGGVGLMVSAWTLDLLLRFAPAGIPRLERVHMDGGVVAFTFLIAIGAGVMFGLAPAFQIRAHRLQDALLASGRGLVSAAHQRGRQALTVAQIALSLMLLVAAMLLIQSFARMQRVDVGFRASSVLTVERIELPRSRASAEASAAFFDGFVTRLARGAWRRVGRRDARAAARSSRPFLRRREHVLDRGRRAGAAGAASCRADSRRQARYFADLSACRSGRAAPLPSATAPRRQASSSSTRRWRIATGPTRTRSAGDHPRSDDLPGQSTRASGRRRRRRASFRPRTAAEPQMFVPHCRCRGRRWRGSPQFAARRCHSTRRARRRSVDDTIRRCQSAARPGAMCVADAVGQPRFRAGLSDCSRRRRCCSR